MNPPWLDSARSRRKPVWSKPRSEAENRGAGLQHGVGLGDPTPRTEGLSWSSGFPACGIGFLSEMGRGESVFMNNPD